VVFFIVSVRKHFLHAFYYVFHTQLSLLGFHQPQQKPVMVTEQYIITTKPNLSHLLLKGIPILFRESITFAER